MRVVKKVSCSCDKVTVASGVFGVFVDSSVMQLLGEQVE